MLVKMGTRGESGKKWNMVAGVPLGEALRALADVGYPDGLELAIRLGNGLSSVIVMEARGARLFFLVEPDLDSEGPSVENLKTLSA